MAYYPGDIPADPLVIEPARDLTRFTGVEIALTNPNGTAITAPLPTGAIVADEVRITWPSTSVLATTGVYTVSVTLTGLNVRERLPLVPVIVQDKDGWHTVDTARVAWNDAPFDDVELYELLTVARDQCIAFAPDVSATSTPAFLVEDPANPGYFLMPAPGEEWPRLYADPANPGYLIVNAEAPLVVPLSYRKAQLLQARNTWNAARVDPASGVAGEDGFTIRPFPMDWIVKNLLRPKRAVPVVG